MADWDRFDDVHLMEVNRMARKSPPKPLRDKLINGTEQELFRRMDSRE